MTIEDFQIREYGRTELAQLYSPDITPMSAWKKLKNWISHNPRLPQELQRLGYQPDRQRTFTPAQVAAIVREIGAP